MAYKKWIVAESDKQKAAELAEICDTDPFLTLIAVSRGYTEPENLEMFFTDEPVLASPYELPDIQRAAEVINVAVTEHKRIAVYGDYDCDGITSTALLYSYLKERGADVIYYLPDRFSDGYGMNNGAVDLLKEKGVELIITVDNGIAAKAEIEYAKALGIGTVVTDHHLPPVELPEALAIVNPHLENCLAEFKDVSGVMVAFKVVCACAGAEPEELLPKYADLLAIGLIADVMPLRDENRSAVKEGIRAINNTRKMGIIALLNAAGIGRGSVNAGKVAFGIAPRLNAVGRMSSPVPALELLLCDDFNRANELAALIEEQNRMRQAEELEVFTAAVRQIEQNGYNHQRVIVAVGEGWHHGVLGIAAAKITERYGKPAILLSCENGVATGSGRSIDGFSLYDCLKSAEDILIKFGGHTLAAGLTVSAENTELLRARLNEYAMEGPPCVPTLKLDCRLSIAGISLDLAEALEELEPFGMGNPTPVFGLYRLEIVRINELAGGKHTKLLLTRGGNSVQVMLFGISVNTFPFVVNDVVDLAVTLGVNEYNGKRNVSIVAKAIKKSDINEASVFDGLLLYDDFKCGRSADYPELSRDDIGAIYKSVKGCVTEETVRQLFLGSLGVFKTAVALDVLEELGLIIRQNDGNSVYITTVSGQKADLNSSQILRKIRG